MNSPSKMGTGVPNKELFTLPFFPKVPNFGLLLPFSFLAEILLKSLGQKPEIFIILILQKGGPQRSKPSLVLR
jgi:hypothetical protein